MASFYFKFLIILFLLPLSLFAQINNCAGALVVCDDRDLTLNPQGPGADDFADPDNLPGCMIDLENNTAWYYFEIDPTAPPGLSLGFTIHPNGGLGEDYDWALFGPDVNCNNLGFPVRCSSSSAECELCPETGMGMGTTDFSEGPGSGDGFVMTLPVKPGEGFYLMIDNWQGTHNGFVLSWTGTAADYLDCDAEAPCSIIAEAGSSIEACAGDQSVILNGSFINDRGHPKTYNWTGTNGATGFLNNPNIAKPTIQLPDDFIGSLVYTLTVLEDTCRSKDNVNVNVSTPEINIQPAGPFCENGLPQLLSATPSGGEWGGATNGNMFDPQMNGAGIHTVTYTYTDDNSCTNTESIEIEVSNPSGITIDIGPDIETVLGESFSLESITNFPPDQIDTIIWSPAQFVECLDPKCFNIITSPLFDGILTGTVYDTSGCSDSDELMMTVKKDRNIYIPNVFSPNNDAVNDLFFLSGNNKQILKVKKLSIYNRWGALVYEAVDFLPDDTSHAWDGLDQDQKMNPGVYVYLVVVEFIDGWIEGLKGDVTIIR